MGDGSMPCRIAGRLGGLAVEAKHPGHHSRAGKLGGPARAVMLTPERRREIARMAGSIGGRAIATKLGTDGLVERGRLGGQTTLARHGADYFRRIGALGVEARKRIPA